MSINNLDFGENTWLNSQLYPPVVSDENRVREMLQNLHNTVRDYINTVLVPAVNSPVHRYFYKGMPPVDGEKKFVAGGSFSWYLDLPGVGRLYANTGGGIIAVKRYSTSYNPTTGETTVEIVTAEADVRLNGGAFAEGSITFTGAKSGTLGTLRLSAEPTQTTIQPMLTEMASLSEDAALNLAWVSG